MLPAMESADSKLDLLAMAQARRLLTAPEKRETLWPVLAAAAFAAVSAMSLAVATIVAPPAHLDHLEKDADGIIVRR